MRLAKSPPTTSRLFSCPRTCLRSLLTCENSQICARMFSKLRKYSHSYSDEALEVSWPNLGAWRLKEHFLDRF
jgi:hypothetical protein